ncbi:vancomycin high temperature exclusion protein [Arcobacter sp. LA11]|uniref:SanA/YdcF family protein n=1 Tax=Arcobacter sp. LA11 TaxID=1898176 RepID=UPI000934706F|nr:ElyC/SanA/YdcF family protein [Arcobacter sp. LA11]
MKFIQKLLLLLGLSTFLNLFANDIIEQKNIYKDIKKVPKKKAALLLGTAKYVKKGKQNYFYTYRIEAAVKLWKANKIDAIVVSGDNGTKYYDETTTMFKDLVKKGVPSEYIAKDHAGFRTFDSIVRAKEIFDLDDYIIISQEFHLKRALYIANEKGQKAIGFAARDIKGTNAAKRMEAREFLAGIKAFLDINVLDTKPKFTGKKIKVNYRK